MQGIALLFHWVDYLELIDWTGRSIRDDKKGYISANTTKILNQLCINKDQWLPQVKYFEDRVCRVPGSQDRNKRFGICLKRSWIKGMRNSYAFYKEAAPT